MKTSGFLTLLAALLLPGSLLAQSAAVPVQIQGSEPDSEQVAMLFFEGELYMEEARYRDAVVVFTHVTELSPDFLDGHLFLARALTASLLAGQVRDVKSASIEALRQYRWILAREPNHTEAVRGVQLLSEKYLDGVSLPLSTNKGRRAWAAGEYSLREKKYADAAASFRQAAEAEPEIPEVHRALGNALRLDGKPKEAARSYEEALRLDPKDAEAHAGLGRCREDDGDQDAALSSYESALALDDDVEPACEGVVRLLGDRPLESLKPAELSLLGRALVALDRYAPAVSALERVVDRGDPEDLKALGVAKYFLGDMTAAQALFLKAHGKVPEDQETIYYLAATLMQLGNVAEGVEYLRGMLERDPNNANALRLLGLTMAEVPGQEAEALSMLRRAQAAGASVENLPCILGTLLLRLEEHDEAYVEFQNCLELQPEYPGAYLALGIIADQSGRRGEAIVNLERYLAVETNPEPGAVFRLGVDYLRVGNDALAFETLRRVVAEDSSESADDTTEVTDTELLEMTSFFLATVRRYDDSIFVGEMLLARDTDNAVYNNNLAMAYADADEKPERALQLAEKANRLDPENPGHLDTLAWVLIRMGRFKDAEETLRRCMDLAVADGRNDLSEIHYHYGVLYHGTGRLEEAEASLRVALENPPTPFLQSEIEKLLRVVQEERSAP